MTSCNFVNYESLYEEFLEKYLGTEYKIDEREYKITKLEATTIDEYISLLNDGYINVEIRENLKKYLVELIEDEWFQQYPMLRWAYATRLLNGDGCKQNINRAIDILYPLSTEGYPGAMCNMADCYCYGTGVERSYERAIFLWIEASKKGHHESLCKLNLEYEIKRYKNLSDEMRLFFIYELFVASVKEKGIDVQNSKIDISGLGEEEQKKVKRIYNEGKKLQKAIYEKAKHDELFKLFLDYID